MASTTQATYRRLMSNKTYIYLAMAFVGLAALVYSGVFFIPSFEGLSEADNVFYSRLYFNLDSVGKALFSLCPLYLSLYITTNEPKHIATTMLKALLLFIVGFLWTRMVFNFFVNETITKAELIVDVCILLLTAVRAYYKWRNEHT